MTLTLWQILLSFVIVCFRCLVTVCVLPQTNCQSILQRIAGFVKKKNVKCSGTKLPRVSLFSVVKNTDIVGYSGAESLVLADIACSLGHKLERNERQFHVSCLTCARTLAKTHANISKLFSGEPCEQRASGKRQTNARSPTGVTPSVKCVPAADCEERMTAITLRRSLALGDDRNQTSLGVAPIQIEMDSLMNLSGDKTVVKVQFILFLFFLNLMKERKNANIKTFQLIKNLTFKLKLMFKLLFTKTS